MVKYQTCIEQYACFVRVWRIYQHEPLGLKQNQKDITLEYKIARKGNYTHTLIAVDLLPGQTIQLWDM